MNLDNEIINLTIDYNNLVNRIQTLKTIPASLERSSLKQEIIEQKENYKNKFEYINSLIIKYRINIANQINNTPFTQTNSQIYIQLINNYNQLNEMLKYIQKFKP
tara:strand:+ start:412 stop:726 length:315 start_codon:yes stop_codon:yes gene_type:complete